VPVVVGILSIIAYVLGYRFYSGYLARHVFRLDPERLTPSHLLHDGMDYVPSRREILFGHHFASIAGLSPMLGPAIAVIWGWLPALLWVVLGTLFIGAVHDFSALVVSMRARGESIGKVAEDIIGPRAKSLFHAIIFFLISLGMGVFVHVVALLFTRAFHPEAVLPTFGMMIIAVFVGLSAYRWGLPLGRSSAVAFVAALLLVWVSLKVPAPDLSLGTWKWLLLGYAFLASVLPVWLLLQPRDYVNSMLLYLGLILAYIGFFALRPSFQAPAFVASPEGAPPVFPFVFIIIACGAVSGFHGLVSSGTTAKQIDNEMDARPIGYGAMIGESLLGLLAVLACTAGFSNRLSWGHHYSSWNSAMDLGDRIDAFIRGTARFLSSMGISVEVGSAFIALIVVSFALTSLDSATRLLRYNLTEVGETIHFKPLRNRVVSSALAAAAIGFFAFYQIGGKAAGLALWQLFGTTNQVLGGLTLLAVTLYLQQRGRNYWVTLIPMIFLLSVTLYAMVLKIRDFWSAAHPEKRDWTLLSVGTLLLVIALWLVVEAILRLRRSPRPQEG